MSSYEWRAWKSRMANRKYDRLEEQAKRWHCTEGDFVGGCGIPCPGHKLCGEDGCEEPVNETGRCDLHAYQKARLELLRVERLADR